MLDKLSKGCRKLSDVSQAQNLIREAFPTTAHGNAKGAMRAAYRKLVGFSRRRIRSVWNAECRKIEHHEMRDLENAALEQARKNYIAARNRSEVLQARIDQTHTHYHGVGVDMDS